MHNEADPGMPLREWDQAMTVRVWTRVDQRTEPVPTCPLLRKEEK